MSRLAVGIWEELEPTNTPAFVGDAELNSSEQKLTMEHGERIMVSKKTKHIGPVGTAEEDGTLVITDRSVLYFPFMNPNAPLIFPGYKTEFVHHERGDGITAEGHTFIPITLADSDFKNAFDCGCKGTEFPKYDVERTERKEKEEKESAPRTPGVYLCGLSNPSWGDDVYFLKELSVRHSLDLRKQLSPGVDGLTCGEPQSLILPFFLPIIFERFITPAEKRSYLATISDSGLSDEQRESRKKMKEQRDEMRKLHKKTISLGRYISEHETELFADQDLTPYGFGVVPGGEMTGKLEECVHELWKQVQAMRNVTHAPQNRNLLVEGAELYGHALDILRGLRLRAEAIVFNTWADLFFSGRFLPARRLLDASPGKPSYTSKATITRGLTSFHHAALCRVACEIVDRLAVVEGLHAASLTPKPVEKCLMIRMGGMTVEFHPLTGLGATVGTGRPTAIEDIFVVRKNIVEPLEGALTGVTGTLLVMMSCQSVDIFVSDGKKLGRLVKYNVKRVPGGLRLDHVETEGEWRVDVSEIGCDTKECVFPYGHGHWEISTVSDVTKMVWMSDGDNDNDDGDGDGEGEKGLEILGDVGVPVSALLYLTHLRFATEGKVYPSPKSHLFMRMAESSAACRTPKARLEVEKMFNTARNCSYQLPPTVPDAETVVLKGLQESFGVPVEHTIPATAEQISAVIEKQEKLKTLHDELTTIRMRLSHNSALFTLPTKKSEERSLEEAKNDTNAIKELEELIDRDIETYQRLIEALNVVY